MKTAHLEAASFVRTYAFLGQVVPFRDEELERRYYSSLTPDEGEELPGALPGARRTGRGTPEPAVAAHRSP